MAKSPIIIKLRKESEFVAKLVIEEGKGYLKFYYRNSEIVDGEMMLSFNKEVVDHYVKQADLICRFDDAVLWSY